MSRIRDIVNNNILLYTTKLWLKDIKNIFNNQNKYITLTKLIKKKKLIYNNYNIRESLILRQSRAFGKVLRRSQIEIGYDTNYIGIPKSYYTILYFKSYECNSFKWGNMTPDYNLFIRNGTNYFIKLARGKESDYHKALNTTYNSVNEYAERNLELLRKNKKNYLKYDFYKKQENFLSNVLNNGAKSFLEALQMLFFIHQLCWMEGHTLIGLGCMDQYLYEYYRNDIKNCTINKKDAEIYLRDFFLQLSKETVFYSSLIYGDTGQVVVIGGEKTNELTYLFLEVFKKLDVVSPKIILKINNKMSDEILRQSIEVLKLGTGSPLFINEDVIKNGLAKYSYKEEDINSFATAACWEPLIPGKSFDLNNICNINFMKALENIIYDLKRMRSISDFSELIEEYKKEFSIYLENIIEIISNNKFAPASIFSSLYEDCLEKGIDLSLGGAKYNNFGFTSIGFANLINALYAINKFVFIDELIQKDKIVDILKNNYVGYEQIKNSIISNTKRFGQNYEEVDNIAIDIANFYHNETLKYKNIFNGCFKPGLGTASAYIDFKDEILTNFDGRLTGEMIASNYSVQFGTVTDPITEINSLTKVDLNKMINGSVMDITFNYGILDRNSESIISLLRYFLIKGGQSIQFNFLDYKTLLDAKAYPEKYSNLIVRVWGMSSYFTKLPEEYQNHIIKRAMEGF